MPGQRRGGGTPAREIQHRGKHPSGPRRAAAEPALRPEPGAGKCVTASASGGGDRHAHPSPAAGPPARDEAAVGLARSCGDSVLRPMRWIRFRAAGSCETTSLSRRRMSLPPWARREGDRMGGSPSRAARRLRLSCSGDAVPQDRYSSESRVERAPPTSCPARNPFSSARASRDGSA